MAGLIYTTREEIAADLSRFGAGNVGGVEAAVNSFGFTHVRPPTLLALMDVETGMKPLVGDGGHGRGPMGIDDRAFPDWLAKHPGVPAGTWTPCGKHNALAPNHHPTLWDAMQLGLQILKDGYEYGVAHGVTGDRNRFRFMLAAYNAGPGGAIKGWRESKDVDRYTAAAAYRHQDPRDGYSFRIEQRRDVIRELLREWHWTV